MIRPRGLLHFIQSYRTLATSQLFSESYYLEQNQNLASSCIKPLVHYVSKGAYEGRDPHPLFSSSFYLNRYPDIRSARMNPLYHFLTRGDQEGRLPHPLFDPHHYRSSWKKQPKRNRNSLLHFLDEGKESVLDPHPLFDTSYYLSQKPKRGDFEGNALVHYLTLGAKEGWNPHPLFDTEYYLSRYPDVRDGGLNPLLHYVVVGGFEGRNPHPLFDSTFYSVRHPGLKEANLCPLAHYVMVGEKEGANPSPFFDGRFYSQKYLQGTSEKETSPLRHFIQEGWKYGYHPASYVNYSGYLRSLSQIDEHQPAYYRFFDQIAPCIPNQFVSPEVEVLSLYDHSGVVASKRHYVLPNESRRVFDTEVQDTFRRTVRGLNYIAPLEVASGLGQAARGYYNAMQHAGLVTGVTKVRITENQKTCSVPTPKSRKDWPITFAMVNADATQWLFNRHRQAMRTPVYRIAGWVWELPSLNEDWITAASLYDEFWVPSNYCKRSVEASTDRPVLRIPYVVESRSRCFGDQDACRSIRKRLRIPQDKFMFLYVFDASSYLDRKNPFTLIECFLEEFADNPEVILVLKVSYGEENREFLRGVRRLLRREGGDRVFVVNSVLPLCDVDTLIASSDCYVSPHRAEGFGLTLAEALLYERPVIATNYSSTVDFLSKETGFPVDYKLIEIEETIGPYRAGNVWADLIPQKLREAMREVYTNPQEASRRAKYGRQFIKKNFSIGAISSLVAQRIETLYLELGNESSLIRPLQEEGKLEVSEKVAMAVNS